MMEKGTWVRIRKTILEPEERTANIPEDTKKVPFEMWVKGWLDETAEIGDSVRVTTLTGRKVEGLLTEANPAYRHSYGDFVPELLQIGPDLRALLFGGGSDE